MCQMEWEYHPGRERGWAKCWTRRTPDDSRSGYICNRDPFKVLNQNWRKRSVQVLFCIPGFVGRAVPVEPFHGSGAWNFGFQMMLATIPVETNGATLGRRGCRSAETRIAYL